jgi:aminoglycoside phosphotransferase (APT) family kinase protein
LEKVGGVELYQVGELSVWQAAARWLARLHASAAREVDYFAGVAPLLRHTESFYESWGLRAVEHYGRTEQRERVTWLVERHQVVIEQLLELPTTLIHGEFYASNILVQTRPEGVRVCAIDWEMAALGPGLMDLAALTSGSWSDTSQRAIAGAYSEALAELGYQPTLGVDFWLALDRCRVQLALQWLGWSAGWQPPAEHAQDWLAEGIAAAERLGL